SALVADFFYSFSAQRRNKKRGQKRSGEATNLFNTLCVIFIFQASKRSFSAPQIDSNPKLFHFFLFRLYRLLRFAFPSFLLPHFLLIYLLYCNDCINVLK